jgi:hypothetical protein
MPANISVKPENVARARECVARGCGRSLNETATALGRNGDVVLVNICDEGLTALQRAGIPYELYAPR